MINPQTDKILLFVWGKKKGEIAMRNKRLMALTMAVVLSVSTLSVPAKAQETTQEYVVMVENEKGQDIIESNYEEIDTLQSEELSDNDMAVVELTESQAEKLEDNKNIALVEENITFEASDSKKKKSKNKNKKTEEKVNTDEEREMKAFLKQMRAEETVAVDTDEQWNIDVVNANEQEYKEGTDKIKVAVLDTGVTLTEDIEVAGRVNFIDGEEDVHPLYEDVSGHGTSVASVIAAKDNSVGITGINPNVDLYSVKVLDDEKKASLSGVIKGIYWCIDNDIDIINMSFGTSTESEILKKVIKEADDKGILIIAAAGNQGEAVDSTVEYPAAYEEVVAVGATTPQGTTSEISSVGEEIDLMAPGEMVPATGYFDEIIETEGTSMAAPHVAGVASVLWAKDRSKSNDFIKELLKASAKSMDDAKEGNGLIDLDYALSVYDEFDKNYVENKSVEVEVEENNEAIETFDETEVNASWDWTDHQNTIGSYGDLGATEMRIIKKGAKLPDTEAYLKYSAGSTDSFHGHYNYVANYMYVMRMARKCLEGGMSNALTAKYPCSGTGEAQIYNGIVKLNNNWSSVLAGETINNKNKARILVGIATHIAMDAYAHKAYLKNSSTGEWTVHISGDANQDSTTYVSSRWTTAKSTAYDILDVWVYELSPDAWEFYQPDYHSYKVFKLYKFKDYVKNADKTTYAEKTDYFKNRTSD